jgi:hypothetical protein
LNPERDYQEIYRLLAAHEFPWDTNQSLSFALYRTYAVPSIGALLARTGEFTERVQKRYDDTTLILDAVLEHGFGSTAGRTAIRRMNQMHRGYPISDDDMRYVLCTFVVVPIRWLDSYGWRALTEHERIACANYYRELDARMNIKDIPRTHREFAAALDDYEARRFAFDPGGRAVADSTLELMTTFTPMRFLPRVMAIHFAKSLMDDALLEAFDYRVPRARGVCRAALRMRGKFVSLLPPRRKPLYNRESSNVRRYPDGYSVAALGTFPSPARPPAGCPVPHR